MSTAKDSRDRAVVLGILLAQHAPPKAHSRMAPFFVAAFMGRLQSAAHSAKRRAVYACNNPLTEAQEAQEAKWHATTEASLNTALASLYGDMSPDRLPTVSIGCDDPRGPSAFLKIPGMLGDGFDRERGFAVY